jgi:hypothetical protein
VRCAVVGHVEWVDSVLVDRVPAVGDIAHGSQDWSEPAGGGAVAAAQLVRLAGACDFFTALGNDEHGRRAVARFSELGIAADVEWFGATRRAFVQVDAHGERTITTVGEKLRRRQLPAMDGYDAVFFVAGEVEALRAARAARFLSATPRELPTLLASGIPAASTWRSSCARRECVGARRTGAVTSRRRRRPRSWTPTAPATPLPPPSPSPSAGGIRSTPRSASPPAPAQR